LLALFPLQKQRPEIERCADLLDSHHGENANHVWRAEMKRLAQELRDRGADEEEVSHQIREFNRAVQEELYYRYCESQAAAAPSA
jgi:hypothetical protein